MEEDILSKLNELRTLFAEAAPTDARVQEQYAWLICKGINRHAQELGALLCRQLLADAMRLPLSKPSLLYSSLLWSATKVANTFTEFHYVPFLNLWKPDQNLRPEDFQQGKSEDGKTFPSLSERMVRTMLTAQLMRPEEQPAFALEQTFGFHQIKDMVVTKVSQSEVKGRKMFFVQLTDAEGQVVMAEAHALRPNPLMPSERKHYVNVGQLYRVLLRDKQDGTECRLVDAVLSAQPLHEVFPVETGYVEHLDAEHGHIHVYDAHSRHFVSSGQRFVKASVGQFVRFIPIVPRQSAFKSAIILGTATMEDFPMREIRIVQVNPEKQYYLWELTDVSQPITETLSPLQLEKGETSPSFTKGFINMDEAHRWVGGLAQGQLLRAVVFLKRGRDKQKRPVVMRLAAVL